MTDELNGRRLFVWRSASDADRLIATVAEAAASEVFTMSAGLSYLKDSEFVPVSLSLLREIVAKFIAMPVPTSRGTFGWNVNFVPFAFPQNRDADNEPNEAVLRKMLETLPGKMAKGPVDPVRLSEQQVREILQRRQSGEPAVNIGRSYGIDAAAVQQVRG